MDGGVGSVIESVDGCLFGEELTGCSFEEESDRHSKASLHLRHCSSLAHPHTHTVEFPVTPAPVITPSRCSQDVHAGLNLIRCEH